MTDPIPIRSEAHAIALLDQWIAAYEHLERRYDQALRQLDARERDVRVLQGRIESESLEA